MRLKMLKRDANRRPGRCAMLSIQHRPAIHLLHILAEVPDRDPSCWDRGRPRRLDASSPIAIPE